MDPQATLNEIIKLLTQEEFLPGDQSPRIVEVDRERLAELFYAMHGWIVNGGFLPQVEWFTDTTYPIDHVYHVPPTVTEEN